MCAAQVNRSTSESRFIKDVIKITSGTALGQAVVVLFSPVLTRLYSPGDFGVFAVYASLLGVITVIGSMRYELAIPLPSDDQTAANVLVLALLFTMGVSCLSGLAVWALGDRIVSWTKTPTLRPYLWLLPVGILGASSYMAFNYWAIRKNDYAKIGHTKFVQGIMLTLTQISLGIVHIKPFGLLLGLVVGHTTGIGTLASSAWRNSKHSFNNVSISGILKAAARYRRFPLVSSYSSLLDSLGAQAPAFLLAVFYGPVVAGWFALSQRVVGVPLTLLGRSVDQVYLGQASRLMGTNQKGLRGLYLDTAKKLLLTGLVFIIPFGLLAPWLFKIIFGSGWLESGRYTQIMAPMILTQVVIAPLSQTLNFLERQDIQLLWVVIWVVSVIGSLGIAYYFNLSAAFAVIMCSTAMAFSYVLHFCFCLYVLKKRD